MSAAEKLLMELEPLAKMAEQFAKKFYSAKERLEGVSTSSGSRKGLSAEQTANMLSKRRTARMRNASK